MAEKSCSKTIDGCAVKTAPLAAVIVEFASRFRRDRPGVDPYDYIAETTLRPSIGYPVHREVIRNIVGERKSLTELREADAIVAAIGRPEVFSDDPVEPTLQVVENPRASRAARARCCGGSLTGAV